MSDNFYLVTLIASIFFVIASYGFGVGTGSDSVINELCNRQQYDFCVVKQEWGIKR